jgi:hypothetical protein
MDAILELYAQPVSCLMYISARRDLLPTTSRLRHWQAGDGAWTYADGDR